MGHLTSDADATNLNEGEIEIYRGGGTLFSGSERKIAGEH